MLYGNNRDSIKYFASKVNLEFSNLQVDDTWITTVPLVIFHQIGPNIGSLVRVGGSEPGRAIILVKGLKGMVGTVYTSGAAFVI